MKDNKNFLRKTKFIHLLVIIFYLITSLFLYRKLLFKSGIKYTLLIGDLSLPATIKGYIKLYIPMWNDLLSISNWISLSRLFIFFPFLVLGWFFNLTPYNLFLILLIFAETIAGISMYIFSYYLLHRLFDKENEKISQFYISSVSFIAGILYMINPYVLQLSHHITLKIAYSFFPLFLFSIYYLVIQKNIKALIIFTLSYLLISSAYHYFFYGMPWILVILIYYLFIEKLYVFSSLKLFIKNVKKEIKYLLAGIFLFFVLSSFWLIPGFLIKLNSPDVGPAYILSDRMVEVLSKNAHLINVLTLSTGWTIKKHYSTLPYLYIFLFIIGIFSLIISKKNKKIYIHSIFWISILLISTLFATGTKFIFAPIYKLIVLYLPFGYILRAPEKLITFVIIPLNILVGTTFLFIFSKLKNKLVSYLSIFIAIILILYTGKPALTGDMNKDLVPVKIPEEYKITKNFLDEDKNEYKFIALPKYWCKTNYWNYPRICGAFDEIYFERPTYGTYFDGRNKRFRYYYLIVFGSYWIPYSLLILDETNSIYKYCKIISVKYLILHNDIIPEEVNLAKYIKQKLLHQKKIKKVDEKNFISVFKVLDNNFKSIKIHDKIVYIEGNLKIVNSLFSLINFDVNNKSMYISDIERKNFLYFNYLITDRMDIIKKYILWNKNNTKILFPFEYVVNYKPYKIWSRADIMSYNPWYLILMKNFNIKSWDLDYGKGLVFTWAKNTTLEIPFNIIKTDNYKLFIRYFKNQKGGKIKIKIDNKIITLNTRNQLNKFVWEDLGTFKLKKREHKITLKNVNGFNAVNLFALIPENEYYKTKKEIEKLLQNKTIIYLFEAESDLYRKNAEISKEFGGNASNGEVLKFVKNGEAWQDIEIVKNGTYRLALKGVGEFKVRIGDHEFILKANSLNFTYTPLFNLTKGKYRLEIPVSNGSYLDVIWLYSTKTNRTIDQLFQVKEKPAEIISYKKINPTLWKVQVNASKPFMLSFAESYDPLWEARVYKDGKLVEKISSIPLYGVINGFYINEIGNLKIVIRYKPQDWFNIGLAISIITFLFCISFLVYDWYKRDK